MTTENRTIREAARVVTAHRQREGAGFIVRRPFPTQGLELVDPFLLLDEMGPVDYAPGEAVGAPDHPHHTLPFTPMRWRMRRMALSPWAVVRSRFFTETAETVMAAAASRKAAEEKSPGTLPSTG